MTFIHVEVRNSVYNYIQLVGINVNFTFEFDFKMKFC